jgi:hypothetical protein
MMASEEPENPFFDQLEQLILSTQEKMRSTTHRYAPLLDDSINYIEGALYSNLIRLYEKNLNEKFFQMVRMNRRDRQQLLSLLNPFFRRAKETHDEVYNKGEVDFQFYQDFRRIIYGFGDDTYWLLLGVERYADLIRCEHRVIQFKNEMLK